MKQYRVSRYTLCLDHEKVEADSPEQLEQQLAAGEVTGELVSTQHVEVAQEFGHGGICEIAEIRDEVPVVIRHHNRRGRRMKALEGQPMSTG